MIAPALVQAQSEVLRAVLKKIEETATPGLKPAVIFDLDDTLLSTSFRHVRILKEFAAHPETQQNYPREASALLLVEPDSTRYLITDTARAAGVHDEGLLSLLRDFWFARFFKNDYLTVDKPLLGAVAYCVEVLAAGGRIIYLTGRDDGMKEGTLLNLSRNGFPMPDGESIRLILKPRFDMPDLEYKRDVFENLLNQGGVSAGFDNEPAYVDLLADYFPRAAAVFVDSRHSGKVAEPRVGLPWIKNFLF
nr:haloacid dehalogenase-like hydrolase [Elusimicrobiota bacterium]